MGLGEDTGGVYGDVPGFRLETVWGVPTQLGTPQRDNKLEFPDRVGVNLPTWPEAFWLTT